MKLDIDAFLESCREAGRIKCPHCGHVYDPSEDFEFIAGHITYHGSEDGPTEAGCEACGKTFWVKEEVQRSYETYAEEPDPYEI